MSSRQIQNNIQQIRCRGNHSPFPTHKLGSPGYIISIENLFAFLFNERDEWMDGLFCVINEGLIDELDETDIGAGWLAVCGKVR